MNIITYDNIEILLSLIGACAWIPILIEKMRRPKIECKILKCDWLEKGKFIYDVPFGDGLKREINGTVFVIYMRLISRNNDFQISDFKVKIKFESTSHELEAYVNYSSNFLVNNNEKQFNFAMEQNILFCPSLKKDEVNDLETHFVVESHKTDVEYIKFVFIGAKKKEEVVVKKEDFKYALRIFL